MISHHYSLGVGAAVDSMTASDALKNKPIRFQGPAQTAVPKPREASWSYVDNNGGLRQFDGALIDGNSLARLDQVLDVQVDCFAKV